MKSQEIVGNANGKFSVRRNLFHKYPKAARHFLSLFPNNYLDIAELKDGPRLRKQIREFRKLLDLPTVSERKIIKFINGKPAYFIIGALLKRYFTFGHHDAFLFREFPLGTSHRADYLLVGRSSDGWSFVFVELESPARSTVKDGNVASSFRKGASQITEWEEWLEANYGSLREFFNKCRNPGQELSAEFIELDITRLNFVIIAGRRRDFKDRTYRVRRRNRKDGRELILHYDNLADAAEAVIGQPTY